MRGQQPVVISSLRDKQCYQPEEEEAGIIYIVPSLRMVESRTSGPGADGRDLEGANLFMSNPEIPLTGS
jgi:hypothetical protein